ncbi:hypothetical protein GCM10011515_22430 [Tsuneonella deserti]|uniref:DUF2628 domain-containing protein n=1 Tax=Tsuneonella deserti TaxID=2035528 RepID=A0ABQ1SCJ8_9SPHN|nr:hypothetical protein [Tsuneonella deserti]GGE02299.1 hypothetical protein GCM10011515_22430 [Tsuneonella deserti]
MLDKFFEDGDWFAPKRFGYGAGLPITWQGWAVSALYIGVVIGLATLAESRRDIGPMLALPGIAIATIIFAVVAYRRTRGGWRWRWGNRD